MAFFNKTLAFLPLLAQPAYGNILPPNSLHLEDNLYQIANINDVEFRNIINTIADIYKPIIKKQHGAELVVQSMWSNSTVNASAQQINATTWQINMYGGLARRPEVTPDAFALVVCHEIGHHLGGFPFIGGVTWAANEGAADYFATQSCARLAWSHQTEQNKKARYFIGDIPKQKCDAFWTTISEQNLCYRTALAGESLATLFGALRSAPPPRFDTPDLTQVTKTSDSHPDAQCRLDTYMAAHLCRVPFNENVIPGKNFVSRRSKESEVEAASYSCVTAGGDDPATVRPRCWFQPNIESVGVRAQDYGWHSEQGHAISRTLPGQTVQFSFSLKNRSPHITNSASTQLQALTSTVIVENPNQDFGVFAPLEMKASLNPYRVSIAKDVPCGRTLEFPFLTRSARDIQPLITLQKLEVGKMEKKSIGTIKVAQTIPDNSSVGVSSYVKVPHLHRLLSAHLEVNIDHPIPSDLIAHLKSPSGKVFSVPFGSMYPGKQKVVRTLDIENEPSQGNWALQLVDQHEKDVGIFQSWSLGFTVGACSL